MSYNCCNKSGYSTIKTTWVKQEKYTLTSYKTKENYGAFSISSGIRGLNNHWINPTYIQASYPGVI